MRYAPQASESADCLSMIRRAQTDYRTGTRIRKNNLNGKPENSVYLAYPGPATRTVTMPVAAAADSESDASATERLTRRLQGFVSSDHIE
jgi:hypothetical protein